MDGLGHLVFANQYENKEKILKRSLMKEEKYRINSFLSKENFDNENNKIFSFELFYLNNDKENMNKKKVNYEKNFGQNDNEYYIYAGEFYKNKFNGYGEIYFTKKDNFKGLFENNRISIGDFSL